MDWGQVSSNLPNPPERHPWISYPISVSAIESDGFRCLVGRIGEASSRSGLSRESPNVIWISISQCMKFLHFFSISSCHYFPFLWNLLASCCSPDNVMMYGRTGNATGPILMEWWLCLKEHFYIWPLPFLIFTKNYIYICSYITRNHLYSHEIIGYYLLP